ncbi:23S rRNA (guanine(745)-N(1))-methyltransferase [Halioglobus japonicus]|nr:23S rRNA (guanine(745)-N(1))-methyltransferase [Halioglobus japonicus]
MHFRHIEQLCCPLDQSALVVSGKQLCCASGHSFDIARQGYVNLLGAQDKRSRDPGDSKAMVAARRDFLNQGHYLPIAEHLAEIVVPLLGNSAVIADAGCGEGYYLQQLREHLDPSTAAATKMIGFDISKWAVQAATRRLEATWLVASNRNIPLAPNSVDCLLSLFGFPVFEAFSTALKPGGTALFASAGPQHLIELREVLYPSVRHSDSALAKQAVDAGFLEGESSTLAFTTAPLSQPEIHQLLTMTPHLFRASHEGKARAAQLQNVAVTVEVRFQQFHKPAQP